MPQHSSATEDFATVASVWSIGIVCWTATCDRILLESLWGNRCWAACGNVSGKPKADRQAGSNQFGTHDPLRSFLHSWTDPRNGQDGNYLFELEAQPGLPEGGSVTTASSMLSTSIEQPLKSSGLCSGANPNRTLLHDSLSQTDGNQHQAGVSANTR